MQPLKTYEVALKQVRVFRRTVRIEAKNSDDAGVLAQYESQYLYPWYEEDEAEYVSVSSSVEVTDVAKALAHYTAQAKEAKATIPGMETEA